MRLYYLPGASPLAAHIVLEWIGAPYETVRMRQRDLKSAPYLARNAAGMVPMLEHGDFTLTENVAILTYLADLHPEAALLGDGTPRGRADVMRWLGYLNSDVHKAFLPIFKASQFLQEETLAGFLAHNAHKYIRACLEPINTHLDGRNWLAGTRSVADPYLFVILRWCAGLNIDICGLDHLARFGRQMAADPGVQAAIRAEKGI